MGFRAAEIMWRSTGDNFELRGEKHSPEFLTRIGAKRARGRPSSIDDQTLQYRRDRLRWLLENGWGLVGWELRRARTLRDLRAALIPVGESYNTAIHIFIRADVKRATAEQLHARNKGLARCSVEKQRLFPMFNAAREALITAEIAFRQAQGTHEESK